MNKKRAQKRGRHSVHKAEACPPAGVNDSQITVGEWPTDPQLARLTALLATATLPKTLTPSGVAQWKPPTNLALFLWHECARALAETPNEKRGKLRVAELAKLAATLGQGRPLPFGDCGWLARLALRLWQKCRADLKWTRDIMADITTAKNWASPEPANFPFLFDRALRGWMPKRRRPDRYSAFRKYLRERHHISWLPKEGFQFHGREEADKAAQADFDRLKAAGFDKKDWQEHNAVFQDWFASEDHEQKRKGSAAGGRATRLKFLRAKAEKGDARAQYEFGMHLAEQGEDKEALGWLNKAAKQGLVPYAIAPAVAAAGGS